MSKIKNIKISPESHKTLKLYCEKHGLKIYKFLEKLEISTESNYRSLALDFNTDCLVISILTTSILISSLVDTFIVAISSPI